MRVAREPGIPTRTQTLSVDSGFRLSAGPGMIEMAQGIVNTIN